MRARERLGSPVRFSKRLAAAAVVALVGGIAAPGIAAAGKAPSWVIQSTPSPNSRQGSVLLGVSCPSATACTAVGSYGEGAGGSTLAERWNGRKWSLQSTPNPVTGTDGSYLLGVSCSSATFCTAVGVSNISGSKSDTLAEHWNGTKWVIQAAPKPPSGNESWLAGVSCPSAKACTAVGTYGSASRSLTLAERWNGAKWALQSTPNPSGSQDSGLAGVSCPSAKACIAAGDYYNRSWTDVTLAERWNGKKWALQPTPNPSDAGASPLKGVSCSSATACTAVGPYIKRSGAEPTLAERYS